MHCTDNILKDIAHGIYYFKTNKNHLTREEFYLKLKQGRKKDLFGASVVKIKRSNPVNE